MKGFFSLIISFVLIMAFVLYGSLKIQWTDTDTDRFHLNLAFHFSLPKDPVPAAPVAFSENHDVPDWIESSAGVLKSAFIQSFSEADIAEPVYNSGPIPSQNMASQRVTINSILKRLSTIIQVEEGASLNPEPAHS